jgi:hypothetical protein
MSPRILTILKIIDGAFESVDPMGYIQQRLRYFYQSTKPSLPDVKQSLNDMFFNSEEPDTI